VNQRHEYILVFRKYVSEDYHKQRDRPAIGDERREASKLTAEEWREFAQSVWELPRPSPSVETDHPAAFPLGIAPSPDCAVLIRRRSRSRPVRRHRTSAVAAKQAGRDYVGIDRSESYVDTARRRREGVSDDTEGEIAKSPSPSDDIAQYIVDGLERQEPTTLRKIGDYANELASHRDSSPRTNSKSGQTTVNRSPV